MRSPRLFARGENNREVLDGKIFGKTKISIFRSNFFPLNLFLNVYAISFSFGDSSIFSIPIFHNFNFSGLRISRLIFFFEFSHTLPFSFLFLTAGSVEFRISLGDLFSRKNEKNAQRLPNSG